MEFDKSIAACLGLNEAIIIGHFQMMIGQAESYANDKYYGNDVLKSFVHHQGAYWHKATISGLSEVFPFWSDMTIKRALSRLEEAGVIESVRINEHSFDKTKSYRINHKVLNDLTSKV